MRIPKGHNDLVRYARRKQWRRGLGYLIFLGLWLYTALSYNQNHMTYPPVRRCVGGRMVLWMGVGILLGFLLFRIYRFYTQRTIAGTIESDRTAHTYTSSSDPGAFQPVNYAERVHVVLRIKGDDGKTRRVRFEQKTGFYQYYRQGQRVVRLAELPYPVHLDGDKADGSVCAACGEFHQSEQPTCEKCGRTLIHPREFQKK